MDKYEIEIDEEIKPTTQAEPGVPWEKMKFKTSAKDFAKLMRDNGLVTYEDCRTNTRTIVRLLQQFHRVDLGAVLAFAKEYEEVD